MWREKKMLIEYEWANNFAGKVCRECWKFSIKSPCPLSFFIFRSDLVVDIAVGIVGFLVPIIYSFVCECQPLYVYVCLNTEKRCVPHVKASSTQTQYYLFLFAFQILFPTGVFFRIVFTMVYVVGCYHISPFLYRIKPMCVSLLFQFKAFRVLHSIHKINKSTFGTFDTVCKSAYQISNNTAQ